MFGDLTQFTQSYLDTKNTQIVQMKIDIYACTNVKQLLILYNNFYNQLSLDLQDLANFKLAKYQTVKQTIASAVHKDIQKQYYNLSSSGVDEVTQLSSLRSYIDQAVISSFIQIYTFNQTAITNAWNLIITPVAP